MVDGAKATLKEGKETLLIARCGDVDNSMTIALDRCFFARERETCYLMHVPGCLQADAVTEPLPLWLIVHGARLSSHNCEVDEGGGQRNAMNKHFQFGERDCRREELRLDTRRQQALRPATSPTSPAQTHTHSHSICTCPVSFP